MYPIFMEWSLIETDRYWGIVFKMLSEGNGIIFGVDMKQVGDSTSPPVILLSAKSGKKSLSCKVRGDDGDRGKVKTFYEQIGVKKLCSHLEIYPVCDWNSIRKKYIKEMMLEQFFIEKGYSIEAVRRKMAATSVMLTFKYLDSDDIDIVNNKIRAIHGLV